MPVIQVSNDFFERAKAAAKKGHRSVPKQLEYWEDVASAADSKSVVAQAKLDAYEGIKLRYSKTFKILSQ
jgi:hypothetical protein